MTSIEPGWDWDDLVPRSHQIETGGMTFACSIWTR